MVQIRADRPDISEPLRIRRPGRHNFFVDLPLADPSRRAAGSRNDPQAVFVEECDGAPVRRPGRVRPTFRERSDRAARGVDDHEAVVQAGVANEVPRVRRPSPRSEQQTALEMTPPAPIGVHDRWGVRRVERDQLSVRRRHRVEVVDLVVGQLREPGSVWIDGVDVGIAVAVAHERDRPTRLRRRRGLGAGTGADERDGEGKAQDRGRGGMEGTSRNKPPSEGEEPLHLGLLPRLTTRLTLPRPGSTVPGLGFCDITRPFLISFE